MYRILIVEDDDKIGAILRSCMEKYGFEAQVASRFRDITGEFAEYGPHLVLMDIHLPYFDGFYWCRQIRLRSNAPILFLSARSGEMDQVMAIENGGDDYVTKPIHMDLLMAKIRAALRRAYGEYAASPAGADAQDALTANGLTLYGQRSELEWSGRRVPLTQNERLLAAALIRASERVVSREELLEALWDDAEFVDDNTLTVNVTRLRKKLDELGLPGAVDTVRGQGYRLKAAELGRNGGRQS
ncbi:response regulator transcription factor [Cohnella candidum]|uniref:DNA-binding response regulator n=1 Tax=Cohnella candidum TaxID=2674991 RepID=A0A3G3JVC5_9BACL|nr:response regulator transcription factor [Cohnella candidum]AYQ71459.1 DNA-binding response regulator [Cohnella candidum]